MSRDNGDDPIMSGYTILAVVSFVIGGLIDKYVFNHQPPVGLLFAVICLFLLFDALNGIKNQIGRLEGKLDALLEKLGEK
jgi:hypothetical protein